MTKIIGINIVIPAKYHFHEVLFLRKKKQKDNWISLMSKKALLLVNLELSPLCKENYLYYQFRFATCDEGSTHNNTLKIPLLFCKTMLTVIIMKGLRQKYPQTDILGVFSFALKSDWFLNVTQDYKENDCAIVSLPCLLRLR